MMKSISLKKMLLGATTMVLAVTALALGMIAPASAEVYDGANTQPTKVPTFNSITKIPTQGTAVPATGNEPDFFEGAVTGSGNPFNDPINDACTPGTTYTYRVYVHNNASDLENGTGNGPSVAHNTKVKISLPSSESSKLVSSAVISSSNAQSVSDTMTLNCNGRKVTLNYVAGSASQYSEAGGNQALSDSIVTSGALIGTEKPNGDMWGCWHQRVWVTIKVVVKEVEKPAPVYVCNLLTVSKTGNRTYEFKVNYTAKDGATFKKASFNFGDGTPVLNVSDTSVKHTYAKNGNYNAKVSVTFMVNGEEKTVTSNGCATPLTVTLNNCEIPGKEHFPKDAPECSPILPKTGTSGVLGMFMGVSILAGLGHYFFKRRFNS